MKTNISALGEMSKNCVMPLTKDENAFVVKGYAPDLYRVRGVAPTYTNRGIGGVFYDLTMNWWVYRKQAFKLDYKIVFDRDFDYFDIIALNQLFLLEEAEMFKNWIDGVYPEEKTEIIKVDFPLGNTKPYPFSWDEEKKQGSFWSNPADWNYDLAVCYYIDINNVKVRAIQ